MTDPLLKAALALADQGFPCFPCLPDKKPACKNGFHDATTDPGDLVRLFRSAAGAATLIGVPTGQASGVDALDADTARHPEAVEWLAGLNGHLPPTRAHRTTSGGTHFLFVHQPGIRNWTGRPVPGIDGRGDGGYIIWYPATGGMIVDETPPQPWPPELLALVQKPERAPPQPRANGEARALPGSSIDKRCRALLGTILTEVATTKEGGRHQALLKAAFSAGGLLHYGAFTSDEVRIGLRHACQDNGLWGDDPRNAERTIEDGLAKGQEAPMALEDRAEWRQPPVRPDDVSRETGENWAHDEPAPPEEPETDRSQAFPLRSAADLEGQEAPVRLWIIPSFIPRGVVTLLSADGGLGKTLLGQQLQTASATGKPWLGLPVPQLKSFGLYCEDAVAEFHSRQERINRHYGVSFADFEDRYRYMALGDQSMDTAFLVQDSRGRIEFTRFYKLVSQAIADEGIDLFICDALHNIFAGNENDRHQAVSCIKAINAMMLPTQGTSIILAHPSKSGRTEGSGESGSTAWNNAVRSRLYLHRPAADSDRRTLESKKSNYAKAGQKLDLIWEHGVLHLFDASFGTATQDAEAETAFLAAFDLLWAKEVYLSPSPRAPNYAAVKARQHARHLSNDDLAAAVDRLLAKGTLRLVGYKRPNRTMGERLERTKITPPDDE